MRWFCLTVLVFLLIATPGIVLGQVPPGVAPSDDCTPPVVPIAPLDFGWESSAAFTNDVNLSDLTSCAVGGGTTSDGEDFVYQLVLGPGHNVTCSLDAYYEMAFVLSTSCNAPLGPGACLYGEVVPAEPPPKRGLASFNTATLGLAPGTYYVWGDRDAAYPFTFWTLVCTGTIPVELQGFDIE